MKIACIIPTYNFLEGVKRISHWISTEYHHLSSEYQVVVVDDHSDSLYEKDFERLNSLDNFSVIKSKGKRSLREAILTGYDYLKEWQPEVFHIIESDAMPQTATLTAMIRVYKEGGPQVGSVSPIYTWNNKNCYPTHKHWFSDAHTRETFSTGPVREVGASGVPFLFSIWRPSLLEMLRDESLPPLGHLDSQFGKKVYETGYRHLRITNYTIEHWMGGANSNALKLS